MLRASLAAFGLLFICILLRLAGPANSAQSQTPQAPLAIYDYHLQQMLADHKQFIADFRAYIQAENEYSQLLRDRLGSVRLEDGELVEIDTGEIRADLARQWRIVMKSWQRVGGKLKKIEHDIRRLP